VAHRPPAERRHRGALALTGGRREIRDRGQESAHRGDVHAGQAAVDVLREGGEVAAVGAQGVGRPVGVGDIDEELLDVRRQGHRDLLFDADHLLAHRALLHPGCP
jgi:hypothetical protein